MIVGVYAEGFDRSWLGRKIDAACAADLRRLRDRYGISVMGEGGEYESMVLDAPMFSYGFSIGGSEIMSDRQFGTLAVDSLVPRKA